MSEAAILLYEGDLRIFGKFLYFWVKNFDNSTSFFLQFSDSARATKNKESVKIPTQVVFVRVELSFFNLNDLHGNKMFDIEGNFISFKPEKKSGNFLIYGIQQPV